MPSSHRRERPRTSPDSTTRHAPAAAGRPARRGDPHDRRRRVQGLAELPRRRHLQYLRPDRRRPRKRLGPHRPRQQGRLHRHHLDQHH